MKTLTFKVQLNDNNDMKLLLPKIKMDILTKQYLANAYVGITNKITNKEISKDLLEDIGILFSKKSKEI